MEIMPSRRAGVHNARRSADSNNAINGLKTSFRAKERSYLDKKDTPADSTIIADRAEVYDLTPTEYRSRQEMFRTNRLKAFNEALLSDPTERAKRDTLQGMVDDLARASRLSARSVAFLVNPYTEKAENHLNALLAGK